MSHDPTSAPQAEPTVVPAPGVAGESTESAREILTLPPLDALEPRLPISEATGQPRRDKVMLVGMALLYASAVVATVAYLRVWWQSITMTDYFGAARLLGWTGDRPGSWQSVVWAVVLALVALTMAAAPTVAGFQAWNGYRWSRWVGVVAALLSGLGVLLNTVALAAIPPAVLGAAVLWLRPVGRYFGHWEAFRAPRPKNPRDTSHVVYGPVSRYR